MKYLNTLMDELDFFKLSKDEDEIDTEPNPFDMEDEDCICTCDDEDMEFDDSFDGSFDDEDFENEETSDVDPVDFIKYIQQYFDKKDKPHLPTKDSFSKREVVDEDEGFDDEGFDDEDFDDEDFDDEDFDDEDFDDEEECECEDEDNTNADFQGIIRTVKGANLVYKRKSSDGDYTELWIYNIGDDLKHTNEIKRAIVAGTDIDPSTLQSEDGSQKMEMFTVGNVQYIELFGLQN